MQQIYNISSSYKASYGSTIIAFLILVKHNHKKQQIYNNQSANKEKSNKGNITSVKQIPFSSRYSKQYQSIANNCNYKSKNKILHKWPLSGINCQTNILLNYYLTYISIEIFCINSNYKTSKIIKFRQLYNPLAEQKWGLQYLAG